MGIGFGRFSKEVKMCLSYVAVTRVVKGGISAEALRAKQKSVLCQPVVSGENGTEGTLVTLTEQQRLLDGGRPSPSNRVSRRSNGNNGKLNEPHFILCIR